MTESSSQASVSEGENRFSLKPLVLQNFACTSALMTFTTLIGPLGRTLGLDPWHAGVMMTISGVAWLLVARQWGAASDRYGRRSVMLTGNVGFTLFYSLLCAFTIYALSVELAALAVFGGLVLLRSLVGLFYGAIPTIGTALVADNFPPRQRGRAMAAIGMATGSSMVAGPGIAGLVAPYGLEIPIVATAILPPAALVYVWLTLPKTEPVPKPEDAKPLGLFDRRLLPASLCGFISMYVVMVAEIIVGFYAIDRLALSPTEGGWVAGIALTCVGVSLTLAQMIVRKLSLPPHFFICIGGTVTAAGFILVALADHRLSLWAGYCLAAGGMGLVWPSISALAANAVDAHEQGAAAGTVSTARAMGTVMGPLLGTIIYDFHISAAYWVNAALMIFLVTVVASYFFRK